MEGTSTNATVKVYETDATEVTATRKNNYYFRDWDPDTTSTASDYPEINIKEGATVSDTKRYWIPGVSEMPITYDSNGNLTADARWTYTYDEENRLITMEETTGAATAGYPDTTITFKYDYLGRRVEKKVVRGTTTESHLRFIWRGWLWAHSSPKSSTALRNVGTGTGIVRCAALQGADPASPAPPLETRSSTRLSFARYEFCEISGPVAELNAASDNALVKTYTWGPDISGSFGGAGGNGGVLIFQDHTSTVNESFYPAYDAQGNVTGLIDTAGNLDAAYEYDPFGKLIRHAGTRKDSMSLLYGTKYTDMESGLIYYGYRYYDPRQGRFINRDPIGEEGGINLYGFVGNSPTNRVDYLGLEWVFVQDCGAWDEGSFWQLRENNKRESYWVWNTEYWQNGCWFWIDDPGSDDKNNDSGSGGDEPSGGGSAGNGNGPSSKEVGVKKEEEEEEEQKDPCDERKALADNNAPTEWAGPVNYEFFALILSFGNFEGILVANEPAPRIARISGNLFGVGVQGGYLSGRLDRAVWIGNSSDDIKGANGVFFNASIGIGVGPVNVVDIGAELVAHNGPENADWSSSQNSPTGPGLSSTFDPANPGSYLEKPKLGIGAGGGVNGFNVTKFEVISDPCKD